MPVEKPDWYCIVNPHAGSGKTMSEWAVAEKYLTASGIPYKTALTNYKFHATLLAYEAALHGYRKILAVGGDGSVHEVLCGIMKYVDEMAEAASVPGQAGKRAEDFTLAVIPIGSGNDWIKSNGVPHDTEAVVRMISEGSFAKQDVVRVETGIGSDGVSVSYMANVGGVGFDSHVCERVNTLKERGKRSRSIYLGALLYTLFHTKSFHTRVVADGAVVYEGEIYTAAFGNGCYSGGGMRQVPQAVSDDGLLDYMIVPKASLLRILTQLPRLYNGTVNDSGLLLTGRCKCLEMSGDNIAEVDGEVKGSLPLRITVTGQQLSILSGR